MCPICAAVLEASSNVTLGVSRNSQLTELSYCEDCLGSLIWAQNLAKVRGLTMMKRYASLHVRIIPLIILFCWKLKLLKQSRNPLSHISSLITNFEMYLCWFGVWERKAKYLKRILCFIWNQQMVKCWNIKKKKFLLNLSL